ncbi:MAG: outer membrane beta-barrel protein [Winogradskyella sp.]
MNIIQKSIILSAALVCITFSVTAQKGTSFGFKGGLNYSGNGDYFESINNNSQKPDKNIGYHFGIFGKVGKKIYLRPELVYTKISSDYNTQAFNMSKLDMPLLVGIKILGPINLFAGPSLQYILDTDFEGLRIGDIEDDFSVGLNFGIGFNLGKIGLDLRYERGFSNNEATILDTNNLTVSNRLDTRPEQLILSLSVKI